MPTYDYVCAGCGHRFEVIHGVHVDGPSACPSCGEGPVRKAFSAPSIHFKGSGWAKKDRSAKPARPAASSTTTGGSDSAAAGDTSATDATPASDSPAAAPAAKAPDGGSTPAGSGAKRGVDRGAAAAD